METDQRSDGLTGRSMTPAAALARHVEWLEYALSAAQAEETLCAVRLAKATKKNREKRAARLVEVRDELTELTALLEGIRELQARSGPRVAKRARAPRPRPKASTSAASRKSTTAAGPRTG